MRLETKATIVVLAVVAASLLLSTLIEHIMSGATSIKSEYIPINHIHNMYINAADSAGNLTIHSYAGQSLKMMEINRLILCPPNYLHYSASEINGSLYLSMRSSKQFYWWPSWLCSINLVLLIPDSRALELLSINGTNGFISLNEAKIAAARIGLVNGMVYLDDMNTSSLRVSLVNGVALLWNFSSNDAAISIVNGVVNLSLPSHYGKYSVSIINGVVNSMVPANSSISISASTGKLIIETPTETEEYAGVSLSYTKTIGSPTFTATVVNGVINVRER